MSHNWENVVVEDDDERMEHYVLVAADEDVEDDFVLTDTDRTVVDADHVYSPPTVEGTMDILDALDVVPNDIPFDEALAFLSSTKLKGIWMLVLFVSAFMFNLVDFLCGIQSSQPLKSETETIPCFKPEEAASMERVGTAIDVREPNVSPPEYTLHPKVSIASQVYMDAAEYYASDYNESTIGIWEDPEIPMPQIPTRVDDSMPPNQFGSLAVWESRYQVHDIEPNLSVFDKAPMIPMVVWDGIRETSGYSLGSYPSMYPAVGSQGSEGTSPVSQPRIPMRSLIPYKAPEIPHSNRMNGSSGKLSALYRPELYPSLQIVDHSGEHEIALSPDSIEPRGSVALTQYTFQEFIRHHENVLVTFYLPCERFHQKYVPLWTNFTNAVLKHKLPLMTATVNCHSHPSICRAQGCYKFPTIRWFRKGEVLVEDYNNGRNSEKLLLFAQEMLQPNNEAKKNEAISYPTIQLIPPPTSHANFVGDSDEIHGHHLPTVAFVKKQRTPAISTSSTTTSNSLALHHVRSTSSPCPIHNGATTPMINAPELQGIAISHRLLEL